jgi:hypothetical protein
MSVFKRIFDWVFKPQVFVKQNFKSFFSFKIYNRFWFIVNMFINPITLMLCFIVFPFNFNYIFFFIGGFILNNIQKLFCEIFYKF